VKPMHQTGARIAQGCLARFKAERIDGLEAVFAPYHRGTAVHFAVEHTFRETATGNRAPLACALEGLDIWWKARPDGCPLSVYSEAESILRTAYHPDSRLWLRMPGGDQNVNVEVRFAMDADFNAVEIGDPSTCYEGRIDYVEWGPGGLFVTDWKSGMNHPKNEDVVDDIQAWMYCLWALSQFHAAPSVTFSLMMLRSGYSARHVFKRDGAWVDQAKRMFRMLSAEVALAEEDDDFPATPGDACGFCVIRGQCEPLAAMVAQGAMPGDATNEDVARTYLAMKGVLNPAEREARKRAKDEHLPAGKGVVLGFKPGKRDEWTASLVDIIRALTDDGATDDDLREHFPGTSISKAALDKMATVLAVRSAIQEKPHEYVAQFRESRPTTTFTTFPDPEETK
jgi:hypothetical protein